LLTINIRIKPTIWPSERASTVRKVGDLLGKFSPLSGNFFVPVVYV